MRSPYKKRGSYVRIFAAMHSHRAVQTLPHPAHRLWFDLNVMWVGDNNGQLRITYSEMAKRGWVSHGVLDRARDELLRRGLIKRTKYCGPNAYHRASLYALTHLDVAASEEDGIVGSAATHDYRNWNDGVLRSLGERAEPPSERGSNRPRSEVTRAENGPRSEVTEKVDQRTEEKKVSTVLRELTPVTSEKAIRNIITSDSGGSAGVDLDVDPVVVPVLTGSAPSGLKLVKTRPDEFTRSRARYYRKHPGAKR